LEALQVEETTEEILKLLGDTEMTEKAVRNLLQINEKITAKALRKLVTDGRVVRTGGGKKGSPYQYKRAGLDPELFSEGSPQSPSGQSPVQPSQC
jgi:predicted HTH transcriptional regulator